MKQIFLSFLFFFHFGCSTKDGAPILNEFPEGGYKYPPSATKEDSGFYFLPLKDVFLRRDSLEASYFDSIIFKSFNEPNISIAPLKKSVFRLSYFDSPLGSYKPMIITLKEDSIIIKEGVSGFYYPEIDTNKLSKKERINYDILERWYPLNDSAYKGAEREYLRSLITMQPELESPRYYKSLWQKAAVFGAPLVYNIWYKKISGKTYNKLVTAINNSVFWACKIDCSCSQSVNDGDWFVLEANTPNKYHMVLSSSCFGGPGSLVEACQELIVEAGLDNKIHLVWAERDSSTPRKKIEPKPMEIYQVR